VYRRIYSQNKKGDQLVAFLVVAQSWRVAGKRWLLGCGGQAVTWRCMNSSGIVDGNWLSDGKGVRGVPESEEAAGKIQG